MDKIICSLEEWDSIIDYHRPNGSSKTWYIKEMKQLSRPFMWGDWNVFTEQGEMFDNGIFKSLVSPLHSNRVEYKTITDIGDNKHIYVINIFNCNFFKENYDIGFKCISEKYLNDILDGKSKILMFFNYEGYSGCKDNDDLEIIEKWRVDLSLPIDSIYYVSGNLLCEKIVKERGHGYQARPIQFFEPWNKYNDPDCVDFKPVNDKYLYLSYNRNPRPHRIVFALDLIKNNLIDKGLFSLNKINYEIEEKMDGLEFLENRCPFIIDEKYGLDYNLAVNIEKSDYEKTFISVVTESLVDDGTLFFSEKIWKPIMVGHPFILYGNKGSLSYLKSIGYQTFGKWIDESYDDVDDRNLRSKMVVDELNKFTLKTIEELQQIRNEMKEICEYNKQHFKVLYKQNYTPGDLSITIENVFDEVWAKLNN